MSFSELFGLTRIVSNPPIGVVEPITLEEAKGFLKVDISDDDTLINSIISSARERAENKTRRQLITATWSLSLDHFPRTNGVIELPKAPIQSVASVKYFDMTDTEQTLATSKYQVDKVQEPGRIIPVDGETWPDTFNRLSAVTVLFTSGYGDDGSFVPEGIKGWMKVMIANLYENRTSVIEGNVTDLKFIDGLLDEHVVPRL
jgi:uncharacterized phiE125 gp8 family phage protein